MKARMFDPRPIDIRRSRLAGRLVSGLASVALVASALALAGTTAHADPMPDANPHVKIRPDLLDKLKKQGTAEYWVRLDTKADLSKASQIKDWNERGTAVAKALRDAAQASQTEVRAKLDRANVQYEAFWATNAIHVQRSSLKMAEQLAAEPTVDSVWPVSSYAAPEPAEGKTVAEVNSVEWGIANINADDVWAQYGVKGAGITVANIDTGVQFDHPALVNQYRGNRGDGTFDHNYNWYDAAGTCAGAPCDQNGHGTHTMGTMAGDDGGSNQIGVAPGVKWITANGCCPSDTALIRSGQWMLEPTDLAGKNPDASKRPHIINNSWGSEIPSNDPFMEDISLAWAASGIFASWSNGNNGSGCETSGSPGSRIINYSVGAYDSTNTIAGFSSRGAGQDGEIKPNIAAPGANIRSSVPGSGYASYNGTSMAAPHLAGAIALLWSAAPVLIGDVEATKTLLDDTGIDTPNAQCGGTDDDNNVFGEGRLDALALVSHAPGGLTGLVTDVETGKPISGATISTGQVTVSADSDGRYRLPVTPGNYEVTFSAFGYQNTTATVTINVGEMTTRDVALTAVPRVHLRGTVTDGSGHGWPLYAKITVAGNPDGKYYTDPYTGGYDLLLPANQTHQLTFDPDLSGYPSAARESTLGGEDVTLDVAVPVDSDACDASGYAVGYDGLDQTFDASTAPDGWTVTDAAGNGEVWRFDNPGNRGNRTRGTGGFATVNSLVYPSANTQDTTLTSPVADLSGAQTAMLQFNTFFIGYYTPLTARATVELSTDNGASWQTVWEKNAGSVAGSEQTVAVPQAAGQAQVLLRFRYVGGGRNIWQVDNLRLGERICAPQPGGLIAGEVTDANTGVAMNGITVAATTGTPSTKSKATADDAALGDGFYTMFAPVGAGSFTAGAKRYTTLTKTVDVAADTVTKVHFPLPAGRIEVSGPVNKTVTVGGSTTTSVTVTNTGGAPASVTLNQVGGGYSLLTSPSATPHQVPATTSKHALAGTTAPAGTARPAATGVDWVYGPVTPTGLMDNVVGAYDGKIYTVGGVAMNGVGAISLTKAGYVLDPRVGNWQPIADQPTIRQRANGAFIGGKLYITGGWSGKLDGSTESSVEIYDPATNTWSTGASLPTSYAASGVTTLDGKLYLVGGCTDTCGSTDVWVYTPSADRWQKASGYPEPTSWLSCGTIAGKIYCAGGTTETQSSRKTFVYDPASNAWTRAADMPAGIWGASYSAANGMLIVSGGASGNGEWINMENYAYDASTDTWSALPTFTVQPTYRGGGACGFYTVGGGYGEPGRLTRILPGFDACDEGNMSWLSLDTRQLTLQPGESATVTVTLNAGVASITQPGDFTAAIAVESDTPYRVAPINVAMHVTPPKTWGKVAGTVTGIDCDGRSVPLAGASVQVTAANGSYLLFTDAGGRYSLWIDKKYAPLTLIASATDHMSSTGTAKIGAGAVTTRDFALKSTLCIG